MKILKNKTAAMFGLDARIALAIFGALSIITGAALYSAIQNAKAVALLTDMQEVGKAWEAYYLDTGINLPRAHTDNTNSHFYQYKIGQLVTDPGVIGWEDPYVSYLTFDDKKSRTHPIYKKVTLNLLSVDSVWGDTIHWNTAGFCTSGKKCGVWVNINGFESDNMAKTIDKMVDEGDGATLGKFKWYYTEEDGVRDYRHLLKIAPIKNPNN